MISLRQALLGACLASLAGCSHDSPRQKGASVVAQPPTLEVAPASGSAAAEASPAVAVVAAEAGPAEETERRPSPEEATRDPIHFAGPSLDSWTPVFKAGSASKPDEAFSHVAIVTALTVPLYSKTNARTVVGFSGIGSRVPARPTGIRCAKGEWLAVTGRAYLCSGAGVRVESADFSGDGLTAAARRKLPKLDRPTPYAHGKARDRSPLFRRIPTAEQLEAIDAGRPPKGVVKRTLRGTFLLAFTGHVEVASEPFVELLSGEWIRERDIEEPFPEPQMRGEHLGRTMTLPIAFARRDTTVHCLNFEAGESEPCGTAAKHARFPGSVVVDTGERRMLVLGNETAVDREEVRIAERIPRPRGVGKKEQWIHIDLTEQTLVAYRGDEPLLATLVSTGKEGWETPRGLYRVNRVYQTKPMNGVDEDGPYQVQEVPWALYFRGNYAVHGAYWHNDFGKPRSHGCVNLPPADARWLFHWSKPRLPQGWTAKLNVEGPRVYVTGETPKPPPDPPEERRIDVANR